RPVPGRPPPEPPPPRAAARDMTWDAWDVPRDGRSRSARVKESAAYHVPQAHRFASVQHAGHRFLDALREHMRSEGRHAGRVSLDLVAVDEHRLAGSDVEQLGGELPHEAGEVGDAALGEPTRLQPPGDRDGARVVAGVTV